MLLFHNKNKLGEDHNYFLIGMLPRFFIYNKESVTFLHTLFKIIAFGSSYNKI